MDAQKAPAAHVTIVTGDAGDAKRGVTRMVTRNAYMVTRNGVTQSLASPVSARRDAAEALLVTRVTRTAGIGYPPYLKRGWRHPEARHPQEGPAARVTIVTTPANSRQTGKEPSRLSRPLAREGVSS